MAVLDLPRPGVPVPARPYDPILIPPPPANANRERFELRGAVVEFPQPKPVGDWDAACALVAAAASWELPGTIGVSVPVLRKAIQDDNHEQATRVLLVMHASVSRMLMEIGELPE